MQRSHTPRWDQRLGRMLALWWLVPLTLAGCSHTPPARFYLLSPLEADVPVRRPDAAVSPEIGVGPVRLASYLDRPQIVRHASAYRIEFGEFDRWSGELADNLAQVVAEDLARLLTIDSVVIYPWLPVVRPDLQVALDVRRFDQQVDGKVRLTVLWKLFADDGRRLLRLARTDVERVVVGDGYEALVAAQSAAVEQLCREIAAEILRQAARLAPSPG